MPSLAPFPPPSLAPLTSHLPPHTAVSPLEEGNWAGHPTHVACLCPSIPPHHCSAVFCSVFYHLSRGREEGQEGQETRRSSALLFSFFSLPAISSCPALERRPHRLCLLIMVGRKEKKKRGQKEKGKGRKEVWIGWVDSDSWTTHNLPFPTSPTLSLISSLPPHFALCLPTFTYCLPKLHMLRGRRKWCVCVSR